MAESESLNLGRARRWQTVLRAAGDGASTEDLTMFARRCLYRTLSAVKKQIPLNDLVNAACQCPEALPELIRSCKMGRDYARLFQRVACPGASREEVLIAFQEAICTNFLDQIRGRLVGAQAVNESAVELRERLDGVKVALAGDIRRIASSLAANPEGKVTMPPGRRKRSRTDQARELLGEDLLLGCLP
jgi:hypothetical protein